MPKIKIMSEIRSATQVSSEKVGRKWTPVKDKYKDICLSCPYEECKSGQCDLTGYKTTAQKKQSLNTNRIKEIREQRGLTRGELSRRAGLNRGYLYHVENGSNPCAQNKAKIASALGVDVSEIFYSEK